MPDRRTVDRTTRLHRRAIELADEATIALQGGDHDSFIELTQSALESEAAAARLLDDALDFEPTRSVLYRSAASFALELGDYRQAEQLVGAALAGEPPEEIANELRDLLEDVYFSRHLSIRGIALGRDEFQMSIAGAGIGFGIAPTELFLGRVRDMETLIYRTAERKLDREFRERGRRKKSLTEELELYISVPRAASLAVTFRLGRSEQLRFPELDLASDVLDDLLDCIELLNQGDTPALRERIPDDPYYKNFVGLATKLAPDGTAVQSVGFTMPTPTGERLVAISTPRSRIRELIEEDASAIQPSPPSEVLEIRGVLLEADATNEQAGKIEIVSEGDKRHRVQVPRGMMSDIVKPWFEETVIARVRRKGREMLLETIDLADDIDSPPNGPASP